MVRVPKTPKQAGRPAKAGSRFISEVVGDHVRAFRQLRRMTQGGLAAGMRNLGHGTWSHTTVSTVERRVRSVSVDELASLAVLLRVPPPRLLDPFSLAPCTGDWLSEIDFGGPATIPTGLVQFWLTGELTIGLDTSGGLWFDWHTPAAEKAAREAIEAQQKTIKTSPKSRGGDG